MGDEDKIIRLPGSEDGPGKPAGSEKPGAEEEKPQSPFSCNFGPDGVFTMRIDMKAAAVNEDMFHMLRGFMDNTRDQAFKHIGVMKEALSQAKIMRVQQGNGFPSFLNPFRRKK